ncbi:MAG: hypothetical protein CL677_08920 [Bdellovibrionaceae bacterium]|nr:hypothetical protein [Pseudobdellovibrionaceae bacterium]|tara:strand:- start:43837 stop:45240 length:1404 start_codon:yes stop_codon:yes gene_type:complete
MSKNESQILKEVSLFVRAAVRLGCRYLSCGGPASRLEQYILKAGKAFGYKTEVFSTPTGVFVSALNPSKTRVVTFVGRVKDVSFNLTELDQMETLLIRLSKGEIHPSEAIHIVKTSDPDMMPWRQTLKLIGAYLVGFSATLLNFGELYASAIAGLITMLVFVIVGPFTHHFNFNPLFTRFLGGVVGLSLAMLLSTVLSLPMEALAIGSVIILIPSLMLTTGISELAEQNYVSGLVKLLQTFVTGLGLFISYLLVNDLAQFIDIGHFSLSTPGVDVGAVLGPVAPYLIYFTLVLAIAMRFQVPRRAMPGVLFTSIVGWILIRELSHPDYLISLTFLTSLLVGLLSVAFGALIKLPSQIFSVPGILSLVPGLFAMSSFQSLMEFNDSSMEVILKTVLIASSIVFGLFVARVPFSGNNADFDEVSQSLTDDLVADDDGEPLLGEECEEITTKDGDRESLSNNCDYTRGLM